MGSNEETELLLEAETRAAIFPLKERLGTKQGSKTTLTFSSSSPHGFSTSILKLFTPLSSITNALILLLAKAKGTGLPLSNTLISTAVSSLVVAESAIALISGVISSASIS